MFGSTDYFPANLVTGTKHPAFSTNHTRPTKNNTNQYNPTLTYAQSKTS